MDMLIPLPEDDRHYEPLVAANLPDSFSVNAPILNYSEKNFRSYTFHYKNAKSMIRIGEDQAVFFFTDALEATPMWEHEPDIYDRGRIRLAMLDDRGNILKVSRSFSVKGGIFDIQYNTFHYDGKTDTLTRDARVDTFAMLLFLFLSIAGVVLTCFLEDLIALPFKLWKPYGKLILCTNILSQILMRLLYVLLYGWIFSQYVWTVAILEILVYSGEFLFYRRKMKDISNTRVLWYTITANTVSLAFSVLPMMTV